MSILSQLPKIDHARVVAAIGEAEKRTSGEIRVVVAQAKTDDPIAAARLHFEKLGMENTIARNGVLIFVAPASRNLAVVGDSGVHSLGGDGFWQSIVATLTDHFHRGEFTEGIVHGVERVGEFLARHFPPQPGDKNELSDEIGEA